MKNEFIGFYEPTKDELDKTWSEGTFVFDANTLLNLYRYSDSTRKDFLLTLTKLKDNLFMPYQVGYEYHANRIGVIENLYNSYDLLLKNINDILDKEFKNKLSQYSRHPSILVENFNKIQDEFLQKVRDELEKQKKKHPDFVSNDYILKQLTDLFKNKVGIQFSSEDLKQIYLEGKIRYEQQVPPGYKDQNGKKNKGEQHIYGDLILWKEIIAFTIKENKPIIFVTDDRKEDWWTIENGKTIRPKEELIKEFFELTGIRILIYNADSFLQYAKGRKLVRNIKEESIIEIQDLRHSDETYLNYTDLLKSNILTNVENPASHYMTDVRRASEALKNASSLNIPVSPGMTELMRSTEAFRNASSLNIPVSPGMTELMRSNEAFRNASLLNIPVSPGLTELMRSNEAFRNASSLNIPVSPGMTELMRSNEAFRNASSLNIPVSPGMNELMRSNEAFRNASSLNIPVSPGMTELMRSNEAFRNASSLNIPVSPGMTELMRSNEAFRNASSLNFPVSPGMTEMISTTEALRNDTSLNIPASSEIDEMMRTSKALSNDTSLNIPVPPSKSK